MKEVEAFVSKFGLSVDDEAAQAKVYLFIPRNQCKNCMRFSIDSAHTMADNIYLFSGFPASNFTGFKHYYFDSSNNMFGIKCLDYGNRFIIVRNRNIESVIPVTDIVKQIDSLQIVLFDSVQKI